VIEELERDAVRLRAAYECTNRNPLGSCAITGTGFPIDRHVTSELLGFSAPTGNTYGSIATVDYLLEASSVASVTLVGVGRFIQTCCSGARSSSGTCASARATCSRAASCRRSGTPWRSSTRAPSAARRSARPPPSPRTVHNTPFGDIVDTEDDLQPLVYSMFRDATRAVTLVAGAMESAEFDAERLERVAKEGWITVTELADTLTREQGLPFKTSHTLTVRFVKTLREWPDLAPVEALQHAAQDVIGRPLPYDAQALETILSPRHFVNVRRTHGGPAPEQTRRPWRSRARSSRATTCG